MDAASSPFDDSGCMPDLIPDLPELIPKVRHLKLKHQAARIRLRARHPTEPEASDHIERRRLLLMRLP